MVCVQVGICRSVKRVKLIDYEILTTHTETLGLSRHLIKLLEVSFAAVTEKVKDGCRTLPSKLLYINIDIYPQNGYYNIHITTVPWASICYC